MCGQRRFHVDGFSPGKVDPLPSACISVNMGLKTLLRKPKKEAGRKRLLVAEDDEAEGLLFLHGAKRAGLGDDVVLLRDGDEVIEYLSGIESNGDILADRPGLLLLDLRMARRSGFDVLRWLKQHPAFAAMAVVVFTNSSLACDRDEVLALGAADFITKPSELQKMVQTFRHLRQRYLS